MVPELGKYAAEVISAYAASLILLAGLVVVTLWRGRKARVALDAVEVEVKKNG